LAIINNISNVLSEHHSLTPVTWFPVGLLLGENGGGPEHI